MRTSFIAWTSALLLASGSAFAQSAAPNDAPNDAQIASIVIAANQVDIDGGKLAEDKASNKDVKNFARQMVSDHSASNKSVNDLAKKLKLKPEESSMSSSLKANGEEASRKLKSLNGAEFDKAYIDHEVAFHEKVLDSIDKTLTPHARNDELKALLMKTRAAVAGHLEHARQVRSAIGKRTS